MRAANSQGLYARAVARFPGGASRTTLASGAPVRYADHGEGWRIVDVDGHELIDLHGDYSALVHGNAFPPVVAAARAALEHGSAFGMPTAAEVELADRLAGRFGWAPRWRFTGSGSEAVMAAVRAARAVSAREKLVRFAGSYHGGWDALAAPGERGVPQAVAEQALTLPAGDEAAFERTLEQCGDELAAVLLDLMPNRAGLLPVEREFVRLVRERTHQRGIALIVDEVITVRLALGGMQELYGIEGDLVTLGKLVGGGLPVGAVGGRAEWLDAFDPGVAGVPIAGTFAANPVSMSAGLAALRALDAAEIARIGALGEQLRTGLRALGYDVGGAGSLCKLRAPADPKTLWARLYERGVLIAADGLLSVSTAMDERVIECALDAFAAF